jgi:hypothetical protein
LHPSTATTRRTYARFVLAVTFGLLGTALTSCSTIVAVQEPSRVFHPYISDVTPAFQVIDRRPTENRSSRQVDASWYYGDEQFSPSAVQVVVDRFARAFPNARAETVLVITELELRYDLARVGVFTPSCSILVVDCFVTPSIAAEERRSRNVVSVRLSGIFNGIAFSDGYDAKYEDHVPDRQEYRVLTALQAVIDKALADLHERLDRDTPRRRSDEESMGRISPVRANADNPV